MDNYYYRKDVRQAILDFVFSGSPSPLRECAFYNERVGGIQRHVRFNGGEDSLLVLSSDSLFDHLIHAGASAFYSSYWRYANPYKARQSRGRDLVWTLEALDGGLPVAKEVTSSFVEAIQDEGFSPLVKYSGKLGFDVLILLEEAEERMIFDLNEISEAQREFTERIMSRVSDRTNLDLEKSDSGFVFKGGLGTCLLSELSWRRGLLLAPMSLHPSSGLVSAPIPPEQIRSFSALGATPGEAFPYQWDLDSRLRHVPPARELVSALNLSTVRA